MTGRDLPGGELDVGYAYDNLGRMTSAANNWGYVQLYYDALSRLTRERSASGGWIDMSYDAGGRLTQVAHAWGDFPVTYDYLTTGEVTAVREYGAASGIGVAARYAYDQLGRRTSDTRGNGTVTSYGYDPASRLTSLSHDFAGTSHDVTTTFAHNPAGQIVEQTRSNDLYAFTANANQNRSDAVNGLNQVTQVGSTATAHDARGNMTSDGTRSYGYDSENRMTSAAGTALYHDPLGRLYQVTGSGGTTRFVYDGMNMVAEYDGADQLHRRHVQGEGVDEHLATYEGANLGISNRRYPHQDERGSVVALLNPDGSVNAVNRYDAYGQPQSGNAGRFQYTGQMWLPEVGLHYFRARMYDARTGRFMQTDPIGYGDGSNRYAYVSGDPVNFTDPSGLCRMVTPTGSRIRRCTDSEDNGSNTSSLNFNRGAFLSDGSGWGGLAIGGSVQCVARCNNPPTSYNEASNTVTVYGPPVMRFVAFDVRDWGTRDFVRLYFRGNGEPINLGDVGLGDDFRNHPSVVNTTSTFEYVSLRRSGNYTRSSPTVTNVTNHSRLFAVGYSTFFRDVSCSGPVCTFSYSIRDSFSNPFDFGNTLGIGVRLEIGTPYPITYGWTVFRRR